MSTALKKGQTFIVPTQIVVKLSFCSSCVISGNLVLRQTRYDILASKPTRIHDTFITFPLKFVIVFYCYSLFTPVCGINNLRANYEEANQLTYLKILLVTLYYLCWRNSLFQYLYLQHLHCADIYSKLLRDCSHQVKASPEATSLQKDINAIPFTVQIKDTVHIISFEPISERLTSKSIQELSVIPL